MEVDRAPTRVHGKRRRGNLKSSTISNAESSYNPERKEKLPKSGRNDEEDQEEAVFSCTTLRAIRAFLIAIIFAIMLQVYKSWHTERFTVEDITRVSDYLRQARFQQNYIGTAAESITTKEIETVRPLETEPVKTSQTESVKAPVIDLTEPYEDWFLQKKHTFVTEYEQKCQEMTRLGVFTGRTWGRLPPSRYGEWKNRRCDQYFAWHEQRGARGRAGWGKDELLVSDGGPSIEKCKEICKSNSECSSYSFTSNRCLLRNHKYIPENFAFPCREYVLAHCLSEKTPVDYVIFDEKNTYFRKSFDHNVGGLIYDVGEKEGQSFSLTLSLQLLPALHFKTVDGGLSFTGGVKGNNNMVLKCKSKFSNVKEICTGIESKRRPTLDAKSRDASAQCQGYPENSLNVTKNLEQQLTELKYGGDFIDFVEASPGYSRPECKENESRLILILPGTLRSFEHLIDYYNEWISKSSGKCYFIVLAVDPGVDISSDIAVTQFTAATPDYVPEIMRTAQDAFEGRLAYFVFGRKNWTCRGGPRCQRYTWPIAYEVLKWALCSLGDTIRDNDVIVKGRPDLHIREALDMTPLRARVGKVPMTLFWMQKFKQRFSAVDDPTDQLVIGGKVGMENWINFFSYTLKKCGYLKSDWIGLYGMRHELIDTSRLHFCMVRHTGIMMDSTKSCNTQPYPGSHPEITVYSSGNVSRVSDITENTQCFTKLLVSRSNIPQNTRFADMQWSAIVGQGVCGHSGPYPWKEDEPLGDFEKHHSNICSVPET